MIKYLINIIVIVSVFASCKKHNSIYVKQLISNFNLESYGNYKEDKRQENNWYSKDSLLKFILYENNKTNHFLYLVQNKNRDTIFKFFDSTSFDLKIRDFVKFENSYFTTIWNPSLAKYIGKLYLPNSINDIYESLYRYNSLNIYLVDSISSDLIKINKPQIKDIANSFKITDKLVGEFQVIKSGSEIRLIKGTLENKKILYKSDVGLELKYNNSYELKPYFFNKSRIELNENNFSEYTDRFLIDKNIKGSIKYYYGYNDDYSNIGISKIDFIFNQLNSEHIIPTSLDSLLIISYEYNVKNINPFDSFYVEPFKYVNGEYFFYIHSQSLEYSDGNFPIIHHLDTINWKIESVLPFDIKEEKKGKKLKKTFQLENLSNIYNSTLSFVLDDFEIVKYNNVYRLIKKDN